MKSYWFRIFRSRRRRRTTVRSSSALFRRHSMFEGLELRSMLSGDGLGDSALVADDLHSSPLEELSITQLLASQLGQNGAPVADPLASQSTADPVADPLVEGIVGQVNLRFTDLDGNVITKISAGQKFKVEVYVDDTRTTSEDNIFGFFEAYTRLSYNSSLVQLDSGTPVVVAPFFASLIPLIDTSTAGSVVAGGSATSAAAPGSDPQLLYTATFTALSSGSAAFTPSYFGNEDRSWLQYGADPVSIPAENFTFNAGSLSVESLPEISIGNVTQNEGNAAGTAVFTVTLSEPGDSQITVAYSTGGGNATAGTDYQATSGTLTFAPGVTTQTIVVTVNGDTEQEENETFQVTLASPSGATIGTETGTATLLNDDGNVLSLLPETISKPEGNENSTVVFTVKLNQAASVDVVVAYQTVDGTAVAGSDYTATSGTHTFTPGQTEFLVTVTVLGDTIDEPNETFSLQLSAPQNATIAAATSVVTLVDDDLPSLSFEGPSSVNENSGPYVVTVKLSSASTDQVTVAYSTANGSATSNDYTAQSGTLTFAPGQTARTITIALTGDTSKEPDETFTINLSDVSNAILPISPFTATIANDDDVPTVEVIAPSPQNEGNSGSTPFVFTVRLSGTSETPITVEYATANGIAEAGSDYTAKTGTLTFTPGQTQLLVTVLVTGDTLQENADETFRLDLKNPSGATLKSGGDKATAVITNDDSAPTITISDASVAEGDSGTKQMVFTVTLTNPSTQNVTVQYATQDGTAVSNGDYTATSGTLTFAPNETQKLITINVVGDLYKEGNEDFRVLLSGATNGTISDAAGIGTILDDASDNVNIVPSTITGRVFVDNNGDGALGGVEKALAGVTVNLTGSATMSTTTNADGTYSFGNLQPGTYTVKVVMPSQYKTAGAVLGNDGGSVVDGGFTITVSDPGGLTANDYHFTTRGLKSAFLSMRQFVASYLDSDSESVGQVSVSITTVTNPINASNATNTSISGTGTVGASISVVASSGSTSTAPFTTTVGANGTWSISGMNVTTLPDGTVTYTVTATENGTTATKTITSTKDTVAPTVDVTAVTNPVNGSNQNDTSVSGTGTAGATVSVIVSDGTNSTAAKTAVVATDGTWTVAGINVSTLANGTLTYTATITDGGGNTATDSITTVKDSEAPAVDVTTIPQFINDANKSNVTIGGTATPNTSVTITFADSNGATVPARTVDVDGSGNWSISGINLSSLADGTITFKITATDDADNATTVEKTATKDVVAPTVTIGDATDPVNGTNKGEASISGTGEAGSTIVVVISNGDSEVTTEAVEVDGEGNWVVSGIDLTSLPDGTLTYTVTATDDAGNTDTKEIEAVKDTVAPEVAISEVTSPIGIGNANNVSISGTGEAGATIVVVISDGTNEITVNAESPVDSEGNWSITGIDVSSLADGTLTFTVTATDGVGNTAEDSIESEKIAIAVSDVTDPIWQANQTNVTIGGTGQAGATVQVFVTDGEHETTVYTTEIGEDNTWSITGIDVTDLTDGTLTFNVKAIDGEDELSITATAEKDTVAEGEIADATSPVTSANQSAASVTGGAEDGSTVTVRVTGGDVTTTEATADFAAGIWILNDLDLSELPDGDITYIVKVTDALGNVTEYQFAALKDTTAPTLEVDDVVGPIGIGGQKSVTVTGSSEAGATITLVVSNGDQNSTEYTATADGEGHWTIEGVDVSTLADGTLVFTVTAADAYGNETVDDTTTALKRTLAASDLEGTISQVNEHSVTISGTGDPAATVSVVARNGEQVTEPVTVEIDDEGNWTLMIDVSGLADGTISFEITASVGEENVDLTITGEKDTVADGEIVEATETVNSQNQIASISGTSQPGSTVSVQVVNTEGESVPVGPLAATVDENGDWSLSGIDLSSLLDGVIEYQVAITDALGNVTQYTLQAVKDTVAPTLGIGNFTSPIEIFNVATVTLSGTTDPGAMVTVIVSDGESSTEPVTVQADESGNWSIADLDVSSLSDGTLTYQVKSKDAAGNETTDTAETTKTTVRIASLPGAINGENETSVTISGTGLAGATVMVVVSDGTADITSNPVVIDESGNWTMTLDVSSLANGLLTFTATATEGESSVHVSATSQKATAPTGEILAATDEVASANQAEAAISGTAEVGATVSVSIIGGEVTIGPIAATVAGDGSWSLSGIDLSTLPDGPIRYEVTVTLDGVDLVLTRDALKDTVVQAAFNVNMATKVVNSDNVTAFTIFGTRDLNAAIQISVSDGVTTLDATVDAAASLGWVKQMDLSTLSNGPLTITITATDSFGNTATDSIEIQKDVVIAELTVGPLQAELREDWSWTLQSLRYDGYTLSDGSADIFQGTVLSIDGQWHGSGHGNETVTGTSILIDGVPGTVAATSYTADSEITFVRETDLGTTFHLRSEMNLTADGYNEQIRLERISPSDGKEVSSATYVFLGTRTKAENLYAWYDQDGNLLGEGDFDSKPLDVQITAPVGAVALVQFDAVAGKGVLTVLKDPGTLTPQLFALPRAADNKFYGQMAGLYQAAEGAVFTTDWQVAVVQATSANWQDVAGAKVAEIMGAGDLS